MTGVQTCALPICADIRRYGTYGELAALLGASLSEQPWDAVVHSAAVSDYRLAGGRYDGKIESDGPLDLRLEKNPKLLDSIKPQARAAGYPEPFLVAFKLSSGADERAAESIVAAYLDKADRVLWNDASALDMAARPFILFGPPSDGPGSSSPPLAVARGDGNPALAAAILGAAEAAASARETP